MSPARRRDVLLVVRTPPPYGGGELVGAQLERLFAERYDVLAVRRARHSKDRQGRLSGANVAFGLRYVGTACARLVARRPRVLYVDVPKDAPSFVRTSTVLLVALALRTRVVGDLAGADFAFLDGPAALRRYGLAVLRRLHRIRVLGDSIAATLAARGLANAAVVPNGIASPPGRAVDVAMGTEIRLLYVGKLALSKGVETLVEGLAAAAGEEPGWRLHLAGEWESEATRERVLGAVAAAGLDGRVTCHGLVLGDAKWQLFRHAHVLVHPTRWDGQPVTILEALACGLPVVATRVGAIPDTVRHGVDGHLMPDGSAGALVAGIRAVVADPGGYAAMRAAARDSYVERFSEAAFADAMARLLESAAGDGVAPADGSGQDVADVARGRR